MPEIQLPSPVILLEDDEVLVVNKPEGLASIPEGAPGRDSLWGQLSAAWHDKLYVVHRLDKETSGVILFAKSAAAHRFLNEQFSQRQVEKVYLALVHGRVPDQEGTIDAPLREFGSGRMGVDPARGRPATTRFRLAEQLPAHSLLEVRPLTGRRHQIRVHLYHLGHPIVGDTRYGDRAMQQGFPRLMLHAWRLRCQGPCGQEIAVEAPIPESFQATVLRVRSSRH
jgi:RluA family pseudouridine synthase